MFSILEDIVGETNWADIVDIKKAKTAVCCSVGWLVKEDSKSTIVMADYSFEDNGEIKQGGGYTTIQLKILKIKRTNITENIMEAKFDQAKVKQGQFSDAPDGKQPNGEH